MEEIKEKVQMLEDLVCSCFGSIGKYGEGADIDAQANVFNWEKFKREASGIVEQGLEYYQEDD
jgi:hypothetical protein